MTEAHRRSGNRRAVERDHRSRSEAEGGESFPACRVNVDTTVQEKDIRFPTDARLYERARECLVKAANDGSIPLRQNYNRKSKHLLCQQSRYAHARQIKRAQGCTRKLKTCLGRVIRDMERRVSQPGAHLHCPEATGQKQSLQCSGAGGGMHQQGESA